MRHAAGLSSR